MEKVKTLLCNTKTKVTGAYMGLATVYALSPMAAMAAGSGSGMQGKILSAINTIREMIVNIGIPLYGLIAAVCIIMMLASSGRGAENAKSWLIRATICAVALGCIDAIISFVSGLSS